jgi:Fatty acid desaturase
MACGYLAIFWLPMLLLIGARMGYPSLAFAMVMLVLPLGRAVFGAYPFSAPIVWSEGIASFLDRLPVWYALCLLVAFVMVIWIVDAGAIADSGATFGFGLSLWATCMFATCVAHELLHRRATTDARVGALISGLAGYPLLVQEHLVHHARSGDTFNAEWPRLDESVWGFAWRRFRLVASDTLATGGSLWRGSRPASSRHLCTAFSATLLTWAAFTWAGGWHGFWLYSGVIAGVTFGIQLMTYLQHWGLGEDSVPNSRAEHLGWENDCLLQSLLTLNLSFHQAHHLSPRLPYYRVMPAPGSPRQPAGYIVLMLLCMVPVGWHKTMRPVLEHWKQQPGRPPSSGRRLTCFSFYPGDATNIKH